MDNPNSWKAGDGAVFGGTAIKAARTPQDKRPLYRQLSKETAFPVHALGPLQPAAEAIQAHTQAPMAMCAQAVLATAALAAQPHVDVQVRAGKPSPVSALFVTIADSGERKTSVDHLATEGVRRFERDLSQQAIEDNRKYSNAKLAWEDARKRALKEGDQAAVTKALDACGPEPIQPPSPMVLVGDMTPEALALQLAGRPSVGLFSSEAATWIGGAGFREDAKMAMAGTLNSLWDGEPIRRLRVKTGNLHLVGSRATAHLMMQPIVADKLFGDEVVVGTGLTARMLVVWPTSAVGTRLYKEPAAETNGSLESYHKRICGLLSKLPPTVPDTGALDPFPLSLSNEAKSAWIGFYDTTEKAIGANCILSNVRAFGAKLADNAARLAAVLEFYANSDTREISLEMMEHAIALATYYGTEALRISDGASVSPDLRLAQQLLDWWYQQSDKRQHLSTIYQKGPGRSIREASTARRITLILEDHGYIQKLDPGTQLDGKPRKEAWRLLQD